MANLTTRYEIEKVLENGCFHGGNQWDTKYGELCSSCREDVRRWVFGLLRELDTFDDDYKRRLSNGS